MANNYFAFKQFVVNQEHVAMKVGTDGVLLGAWAGEGIFNSILDIGTGSGLIALMLAQRFSNATIHAIDIDELACGQASENFRNSLWNDRLSLANISIQDYVVSFKDEFDLVVCNPPFYENGFKSPVPKRNIARHAEAALPVSVLFECASCLNRKGGHFAVIVPFEICEQVLKHASTNNYNLFRQTNVKPTSSKMPKRVLLEFVKNEDALVKANELILEKNGRHDYSPEYKELTRGFYLYF